MNQVILILLGGGIGSLFRYWLSTATYFFLGRSFPFGTLTVNILGSFLIGFLSILLLERLNGQSLYLRPLLIIGFLGGFTTFSSFSIETLSLFENGEIYKACLNMFVSVIFCMLAVTFGALIGRQL